MVQEETPMAEKIKLFPNENMVLNKKFNNRKPDIWFKNHEKEREDMFKKHNFKILDVTPYDPNFDLFKFLGEVNLYISKLREKNAANKVINKIAEDSEKIVAVTKLKELKRYMPKTFYQIAKNEKHTIKNKTDKN